MTLAPVQTARRPLPQSSEVFAAGSSASRRRLWIAIGCALLALAYFDWVAGDWAPSLSMLTAPTALLIGGIGAVILALGLWRRARSHEVRAGGIMLVSGGPIFGDRQLIPWGSVTYFGGRRVGSDEVCLFFRQQHIARDQWLPGAPLSIEEYDRLIDRLRVVLGKRFGQLELGGLVD